MKLSDAKMGILVKRDRQVYHCTQETIDDKTLDQAGFIVGITENAVREVCFTVNWQDGTTSAHHPVTLTSRVD